MIGWAVEALIASALLMAVVLVIRAPVRRYFGPGIAYALWAIPAIRLFLPPLPQLQEIREAAAPGVAQTATDTITYYVIEPLGGSAAAPASIYPSLGLALAVAWGAGAAAFMVWHAVKHWLFCRRMLAATTSSDFAGAVEVIETDAASGPLAFGIFRRYVAFPRDFAERYDMEERELALAHELGHHQRGDLIANWFALAVLAAHWFNPLAWRAFRAFRADQEMANDARVLAGRSAIDRHTYACAIVKAAHGGAVSAACHLHTIQDLKGRLRMLTTGRRSRLRLTLGGTAVAALMIGGLAGTASGTTAAAAVRTTVEKTTGIDITTIDSDIAARLQSTPSAPSAPEGADLPPPPGPPGTAPVAPPAPGQRVKTIKIIKMDKDGNTISEDVKEIPDMPPMPAMPRISARNCDVDGKKGKVVLSGQSMTMTEDKGKDGKGKVVIICNDRIERVITMARSKDGKWKMGPMGPGMAPMPPMPGMAPMPPMPPMPGVAPGAPGAPRTFYLYRNGGDVKGIERNAYMHALIGLRHARERIANNPNMSADAKKGALDGIDESIKELESDLAKAK